jgi:hypothetical protein
MREIKIYCDGCSKNLTGKKSYRLTVQAYNQEPPKDLYATPYYGGPIVQEEIELCPNCYDKFTKYLNHFRLRGE